MVTVTLVALLASGVTAGALANDSPRQLLSRSTAERFLLSTIEDKVNGDWDKAWRSLYPPHQRIAPHDVFVRCETKTPFVAPLKSLRVRDVRAAAVHVPGRRGTVSGVAIELEVRLRWYGPRDPIVFRHTFHLVRLRGHWKWLLSPSRYRLYAQGACGADPRFTAARAVTAAPAERATADRHTRGDAGLRPTSPSGSSASARTAARSPTGPGLAAARALVSSQHERHAALRSLADAIAGAAAQTEP